MLEKTMALLNEQGCLVIAIENQLGLKYFAGAPEDHLGMPSLGIEDQYTAKGVRTYGKQALARLLQQAGFHSVEFLHPFPDYKMPTCVLAEQAFDNPSFNAIPFLVATAGKGSTTAVGTRFQPGTGLASHCFQWTPIGFVQFIFGHRKEAR